MQSLDEMYELFGNGNKRETTGKKLRNLISQRTGMWVLIKKWPAQDWKVKDAKNV